MIGYIVEEIDECPVFINHRNEEIVEYWRLYSPLQKKRFNQVLRQLNKTWYEVYNQIKFMRDFGTIDMNECNNLMNKVHKLFIIKHKAEIDYYNEEKIRLRKNKHYISKKINKIKNSKNKI